MDDFSEFSLREKLALSFMESCIEMRTQALALVPWWRRKAAVRRLIDSKKLSPDAVAEEAFNLADAFLRQRQKRPHQEN